MAQFQLNPALDVDQFAEIYARDGMVQVPEIFSPAAAALIAEELERRTPWRLTLSAEAGKPAVLTKTQMAEYSRENLQRAMQDSQRFASEGFAYTYLAYLMNAPKDPAGGVSDLLHDLADWLTGETFRALGARLIGLPTIDSVDAKATLFRPGDFLTMHDDTAPTRRAAYTLGFSRQWRGDWGGQLLMHDAQTREITRGFAPRFNTLNLFATPQWHSVAQVASYATAPRLSVVGWLKTETP